MEKMKENEEKEEKKETRSATSQFSSASAESRGMGLALPTQHRLWSLRDEPMSGWFFCSRERALFRGIQAPHCDDVLRKGR